MVAGCTLPDLMKEDAPQREYLMRELLNGLRYVIRYVAVLYGPWGVALISV
jgi:hypothetical protein